MVILHLIFKPSLPELQSPNPQRSPAASAVWLNQFSQIWPKSERILTILFIYNSLVQLLPAASLNLPRPVCIIANGKRGCCSILHTDFPEAFFYNLFFRKTQYLVSILAPFSPCKQSLHPSCKFTFATKARLYWYYGLFAALFVYLLTFLVSGKSTISPQLIKITQKPGLALFLDRNPMIHSNISDTGAWSDHSGGDQERCLFHASAEKGTTIHRRNRGIARRNYWTFFKTVIIVFPFAGLLLLHKFRGWHYGW